MTDEDASGGDEIDDIIASHRRINDVWEKEALGLELYEYAWVLPAELNDYAADRWRVPYFCTWFQGRLLMERKRLVDDCSLREIAG